MAENGGNLTARQARAIAALVAHPSQQEAAEAAGVGLRTLERWLAEDGTFQAALLAAEGVLIDEAARRLLKLQQAAIDHIESILVAELTPAAIKLRSAIAILEFGLKLRELRNVESRLAALEQLVAGKEETEGEN